MKEINRRELMKSAGVLGVSAIGSGQLVDVVSAQEAAINQISGVVETESGPLENATVVAVPHNTDMAVLETTTDSNGEYSFTESQLYTGDNLYIVVAYAGTESTPLRSEQNYPFVVANGGIQLPDTEIERWDSRSAFTASDDGTTISSWPGENGEYTVTGGSPTVRENGINGFRSVEFNGSEDFLTTSFPSVESQPNTIFVVLEYLSADTSTYGIAVDGDTIRHSIEQGQGSGNNQINAGNNINGGNHDSPTIITGVFDGTNGILRVNGTEVATGDVGTNGLDGMRFGEFSGGSNHWYGYIGEVIPYPERLSSGEIEAQEEALSDKWNISI